MRKGSLFQFWHVYTPILPKPKKVSYTCKKVCTCPSSPNSKKVRKINHHKNQKKRPLDMDLRNYDGTAMATVRGHQLPVAKPKMHPGKKQGQRWTQLDERDIG